MNAQGKLLLYIAMICLIFYFVQDRFNLFDISFVSNTQEEQSSDASDSKEEEKESFNLEKGTLTITRGEPVPVVVNVEIADTEEERAQGLMYRESLENYSGMLFVFEEEANNAFWMKNTSISLDLIFVDSGKKIVDVIENAQPCTEGHICPTLRPQVKYMYCLEVNGGFVEENRIGEGNSVDWTIE